MENPFFGFFNSMNDPIELNNQNILNNEERREITNELSHISTKNITTSSKPRIIPNNTINISFNSIKKKKITYKGR